MNIRMSSLLTKYLEFLPAEASAVVERIRDEGQDPISILAGIHWISHHPSVPSRLALLIIQEMNKIIGYLGSSPYSTLPIKSVASLTVTPDKCFKECFGDWEDYAQIQSVVPFLEMKLGRPMFIRHAPNTNLIKPFLWKRLQRDSVQRRVEKKMADGN